MMQVHPERKEFAEHTCDVLRRGAAFDQCRESIDYTTYFTACMNDVCG